MQPKSRHSPVATEREPTSSLVLGIRLASRTLVRELGFLGQKLAGTDLTPSQVHALLELENNPGLKASQLKEVLRLDKSATSRLLMDLVRRRLLRATTSASDRRARTLALTARGHRLLEDIHRRTNRQVAGAIASLDSRDRKAVLKGLQLFAAGLVEHRTRPGKTG